MKRKIEVSAGKHIRITATIDTKGYDYGRDEVESARDALADQLQQAAASVPKFPVALNRVRVR